MTGAVVLLLLATLLVIAVKALPLLGRELEARRLDQAVRTADGAALRRALAGDAAAAELGRALRRLRTPDLLALGDRMAATADEERGAQLLAAIVEVVERRQQVLARWQQLCVSQRPQPPETPVQ